MSEQSKEAPKTDQEAKNTSDSEDSFDQGGEAPESKRGAKRRIIDETLLDEDEARRLEARRAYNRQCAAKARKRSKDLISHLQQQVDELAKDKAALERTNEVMQAQLQLLEQQNRTLMMNQRGPPSMMSGVPGARSLLSGFQGGGSLMSRGGGLPSVSLLESLSAQGRLNSLQGDNQQGGGLPPGFSRGAAPPSSGGPGGIDPTKFYHG